MSPVIWSALGFALMLLAGEKWRLSRRRDSLNRALHEIRRPLQVLALAVPGAAPAAGALSGSRVSVTEPVLQAMSALGDLDRELNGGSPAARRSEMVAVRLMADGCVRRWQSRASLSGSRIELAWSGSDVLVRGDGVRLAAALENLIVNAIEHGGPEIKITGRAVGARVRIEVRDNGVRSRPSDRPRTPAQAIARLSGGGSSHGHGLTVAADAASGHGGRLETEFSPDGSLAAFVLPRVARSSGRSSAVKVNW